MFVGFGLEGFVLFLLSEYFPIELVIRRQKLIVGLYYCELHAASQVELQAPEYRWKFNKARQGWLMRNVWNDTEVSTFRERSERDGGRKDHSRDQELIRRSPKSISTE